MKLGDIIREKRKARGLSQQELADRVGLSKGGISKIENNKTDNLKIENRVKIAEALGLDPDQLINSVGEGNQKEVITKPEPDLREAAKHAETWGGVPVSEEDIDLTVAMLDTYYKNKAKKQNKK